MAEKILVVDDDFETISFLTLMLTRLGYQVISAKEGTEALKLAQREHPDLIILDVMMPDIDGFEVTRSLRSSPETETIPILMFTAKSQINDKVAGYAAGADFYLTKPVHPLELQANVKSLMSHRRAAAPAVPAAVRGYSVGVVQTKGGLGASTLALNLAVAFQHKYKSRVVAAELHPGQGTWAQELGLLQFEGLANVLCAEVSAINQAFVDKQLIRTPFDVRLLLASNQAKDVPLLQSIAQYEALLEALPMLGRLAIFDIGTNQLPAYASIIEACDEIILVIEPQPMVVKRSRQLLDELRLKGFGSSKVLTIVTNNRVRTDMSISVTQIQEILGAEIAAGFPPVPEQAYFAGQRNVPIFLVQPEGVVAQQYLSLADQITRRLPAV